MLRWQRLRMGDGPVTLSLSVCGRQTGYLAATVIRPGVIAGMKSGRIDWLRAVGSQFSLTSTTPLSLPQAVACFASAPTNELLVVSSDGVLERVPVPVG